MGAAAVDVPWFVRVVIVPELDTPAPPVAWGTALLAAKAKPPLIVPVLVSVVIVAELDTPAPARIAVGVTAPAARDYAAVGQRRHRANCGEDAG